jgi:ribosome-associated translation inhibitor RaiA
MKIDVTGVDVRVSEVLRQKVERRVLLAISRFGPRVRKVTVCLAEPVNPLGGVDQRCRMRAFLQASDDIHSEAINGGFEAAVARAAVQLAKRVGSALDGGPPSAGTDHRRTELLAPRKRER